MRLTIVLTALSAGLFAAAASAQSPTPNNAAFDGKWSVVLTCPPQNEDDDGAKGYVHRWSVEVKGGIMHGTYGTEGEPSYHLLSGIIAPDGKADLKLDGIVSRPDYAINNAWRGKPYTYRVRAKFEGEHGTGVRAGRRKCEFAFAKI